MRKTDPHPFPPKQSGGRRRARLPILLLVAAAAVIPLAAAAPAGLLTLRDAVARARASNHGLNAARLEEPAQREDVRQARSFFLPQVAFQQNVEHGDEPGFVFARSLQQGWIDPRYIVQPDRLAHPDPLTNLQSRLTVRQLLYDGGSVRAAMRQARAGEQAAAAETRQAEEELTAQVVESYLQVIQLQKQMEVADKTAATLQASAKRAADLLDQGLAVQSDVLQVQVRLAEVERERIALVNATLLARANLARLMAADEDDPPVVSASLSPFRPLPTTDLADCQRRALSGHPRLDRLARAAAAADAEIRKSKGDYLPKIGIFADYDFNTDAGDHHADGYVAGASLQWELLDGFGREARVAKARIRRAQVDERTREAEGAVRLAVRKAWLDLDTAARQVAVAQGAAAQAGESLRIVTDRYQNGLTTVDDLLGAQAALTKAESDQVQAAVQYCLQYARLGLAVGDIQPYIETIQQEMLP